MLPVRLIWMALSTLTLLAGWLFSSKTKRQSATNQNAEFNYDGVIAHICVVHWKLLELPNSAKIKTFYDELSIPQPHEHDMQALKISASSTIIARKKELGQHQPWSLQGPKGRGRETKSSPQDARLFVLTLIYDILTTSKLRDIYDQVFMPGLTGYWSDPRAFLQNICMWIEEEEYMGN